MATTVPSRGAREHGTLLPVTDDDAGPLVLHDTVAEFRGPYWTLSNFSVHPMLVDGHRYATVEHYFQAMKATSAADHDRIRDAATPDEAKRLGREVALAPDWRERRTAVMRRALAAKFTLDSEAGRALLATGEATLLEGNDWDDRLWGVSGGRGRNLLGVLLTERRGVLRHEQGADALGGPPTAR